MFEESFVEQMADLAPSVKEVVSFSNVQKVVRYVRTLSGRSVPMG